MKLKASYEKASENGEKMTTEQSNMRCFIDFEWYRQRNRSFATLASGYLCPVCHKRLMTGETEVSPDEIVSAIRDCCSKTPGFITSRLPILESVFRIFLANGNQPLTLEELGEALSEQLEGETYRTSPEILHRLITHDQYYGLRELNH